MQEIGTRQKKLVKFNKGKQREGEEREGGERGGESSAGPALLMSSGVRGK